MGTRTAAAETPVVTGLELVTKRNSLMATEPTLNETPRRVKSETRRAQTPDTFAITEAERQAGQEQARQLMRFHAPERDFDHIREGVMRVVETNMRRAPLYGYEPTELSQSKAAADYLDGFVRYSDGTGWVVYDLLEGRFKASYGEAVVSAVVKRLAQERWDLRKIIEKGDRDATDALNYAKNAIGKRGVANVIDLLKHEPTVFCLATDFDRDPYLLNCRGTTIDLRNGAAMPSLPEHLHLKSALCVPATDGQAPERWGAFIAEITLGRLDLAAFLTRLCGYALTADTSAQWYFNLHGKGRNGKGVFLHVLKTIMGDYAVSLPTKAVVLQGRETEGRFELADLPGARLAVIDDVPAGRLAEGVIKLLTGGDMMRAEQKYQASYPFKPIAKLLISSNDELTLSDTGTSMRRRIRLIPFDFDATAKDDPDLERALLAEAPRILALCIAAAGAYLADRGQGGFPPCAIIDNASKAYVDEQDVVQQFLEAATESGGGLAAGALYQAYEAWCATSGYKAKSAKWFASALKKKGIEKTRVAAGMWYSDVRLKTES
jgi:putative DNA primase/helicase